MFSRQYVFETKRTQFIRWLKNTLLFVLLSVIGLASIGAFLILYSSSLSEEADSAFFKKDPDLIAVYTGDAGRISYALDEAKRYKNSKILISGVYGQSSAVTVLKGQGLSTNPLQHEVLKSAHRLEIDHWAQNTMENVLSTFRFIRLNHDIKTVLIISSDYHMLRINSLVHALQSPQDQVHFYFKGISADYTQWRNIKILYKEVIKNLKSQIMLLLMEERAPKHD